MSPALKFLGLVAILAACDAFAAATAASNRTRASTKRPLTVSDIIRVTRIAGSPYFAYRPKSGFATFSPDQEQFAIVVFRGNVETNTNDYSLLLFQTAYALERRPPRVIATVSSASNLPGIFSLHWSADGHRIYFLATVGNDPTQLYSVDCSSGKMTKLTDHGTPLTSYSVSSDAKTIVYEAEGASKDLVNPDSLRRGLYVTDEELSDLVRGSITSREPQLFVREYPNSHDILVRTEGELSPGYDISVSPDGQYLVLETDVMEVPQNWSAYQDSSIQAAFRRGFRRHSPTGIMQYEVIDLKTDKAKRLLNSPAGYCPSTIWSPDSGSVLLCGTYLPLDATSFAEKQARRSKKFVVDVDVASGATIPITDEDLFPIRWDPRTGIVEFQTKPFGNNPGNQPKAVFYQKTGTQWRQLSEAFQPRRQPEMYVEEDRNKPPEVVAVDPQSLRKATLLDLNPGLADFELAKEELVVWSDGSGSPITGGLYLPASYVPGKRYPLVIQTHGFDPHAFWPDGPYSSGFAAQVLAERGIAVLQMNDIFYDSLVTRHEAARVMKTYENAINYLYRRGIVDRNRVGLLGFSRTCYYVKYALTNSKQRFAAAVVSDGVDVGYMQYLVAAVARPQTASEFEAMIGSAPFGSGLQAWIERSPGFRLDRVRTPLLIQAFEPESLLDEWQWFAGLKRLGKPVGLLYLPTGTHVLVKPWDRRASEEATADWFWFWLLGKEDPDPAKGEQYARWNLLRSK